MLAQNIVVKATCEPQKSRLGWAAAIGRALKARALQIVVTTLVALIVFLPQFLSHASTTIAIDTDVLFSSVNDWITVFLPIAAIGLGIAIALAVIAFVGDAVLQGFRRGRA